MGKSVLLVDSSYPMNTRNIRLYDSLRSIYSSDKITFIAWNRSGRKILESDKNMPIYSKKSKVGNKLIKIKDLFGFYRFIRKYNKKNRPDIIIASHWDNLLLTILSSKKGQSIVYENLDVPTSSNKLVLRLLLFLEKCALRRVDLMIVASRFFVDLYDCKRNKIIVVENKMPDGVEKKINYNLLTNKEEPINIVFLGTIRYRDILQKAVKVISGNSRFNLHLYGDGPDFEYISNLSEGIDNIFVYGRYNYDEIVNIYKKTDLIWAVYPSDDFNVKYAISNKFHESLQYAVPGIFAANTKLGEFVGNNKIGFQVDCLNEDSLRDFLNTIDKESILNIHRELLKWQPKEKSWSEEIQPFLDYLRNIEVPNL